MKYIRKSCVPRGVLQNLLGGPSCLHTVDMISPDLPLPVKFLLLTCVICFRVSNSYACIKEWQLNPLTPNDPYRGRTAPLNSKRCILYIYSSNICTEYFKHGIYSPFFLSSKCSLFHNSNVFGFCIIHILYTECAKIKKKILAPKG